MATVYLAHDLKHDRLVAVKVLKPELAAVLGAERFVVEIKTTASMSHPHILPLFDSGAADGFLYYVMPYIEGETLRGKLDRETQLGIDESVRIAREVLDALEYAHSHGVIHRDIKPENILMQGGRPMIADFGIALAVSAAAGGRMTETGLSLGTPHYMSPEQATAEKEISGRSDIYSLASVLYEMLAGQPPHLGGSAQQIIMKIIAEQPAEVTTLRKSVPANVAAAVAKALEKLPADRFATAHEFMQALADPNFRFGSAGGTAGVAGAPGSGGRSTRAVAAALLLLVGAAGGAWIASRTSASDRRAESTVRFTLALPGDTSGGLLLSGDRGLAVSPDGNTLIVVGSTAAGGTALFVREMADVGWREMAGTEGAKHADFSPDGEWIAFIRGDALWKMPAGGGPVVRLASVGEGVGKPSWGPKGRIVLSIGSRLATVDENGGAPRFVPDADSAVAQLGRLYPFALDDGTHALFSLNSGAAARPIGVVALETGAVELLGIEGQVFGLVDGVLIVGAGLSGDVSGVRFDERTSKVDGDPVVLTSPGLAGLAASGPLGAVSRTGVFAYAAGTVRASLVEWTPGRPPRVLHERATGQARYSPDGGRIVTRSGRRVWVLDLAPGAVPRQVTADTVSDRPEWAPDGKRIVFRSRATGRGVLMIRSADGNGEAKPLLALPDREIWQGELSSDGRTIVYRTGTQYGADIWSRSSDGDGVPQPVAATSAAEHSPRFSPDGRWIAYVSTESGTTEVYVRAFPISTSPVRVSVDGGEEPAWSRDGPQLFYRSGTRIVRAAVRTSPEFGVVSREVVLTGYTGTSGATGFDVAPNGRDLVFGRITTDSGRIVVVHGWTRELRERFTGGAP